MGVSIRALNAKIAEIDTIGVLASIFRYLRFHRAQFLVSNLQAGLYMAEYEANHNIRKTAEGF